jgi:hypothetical protein
MGTLAIRDARPLEQPGGSPGSQSSNAFFLRSRSVVTRVLDAFVRSQIRRLDRRIAALDGRFLR